MFAIPFTELAVQEADALGLSLDAFRDFYNETLPRMYGFLHRCGGVVPVRRGSDPGDLSRCGA